jgi:hypothetical protein
MSVAAVGAAAVGVVGSSMAASSAASAQIGGSKRAIAEQRRQYDLTRADNKPWMEAGTSGINRLQYLLGLDPNVGGAMTASKNPLTASQLRAQLLPKFSTTETTGHRRRVDSSWRRGQKTTTTIDEAALDAEINKRLMAQAKAQAAVGLSAKNDPEYGSLMRNFSMADFEADPVAQLGLEFGLNEGTKGINRLAAAGGGLQSGATLKALTRFGNDLGNTKANESYNRYNANRDSKFNKLAGISNVGQTATAQVGAAGSNMANNVSNNLIGAGNARAASSIAQGNALAGGISSAVNSYQMNQLLKKQPTNSFGWAGMGGFGDSYGTSYGE